MLRAQFPLMVLLKTAPSIVSYLRWNEERGIFFTNNLAEGYLTLKELLVALRPHRLQQTRRLPSSDHLVLALTHSLNVSWYAFSKFCEPVMDVEGNPALQYPQNIPSVAFTMPTPPPQMVECGICCDEFVDTVDMPCCHHVCPSCWRRMLLNFYSHQVTKVIPYVHCPFESCKKRIRCKQLKSFFSEDEYTQLRSHIRKMREPDLLKARCHRVECRDVCQGPVQDYFNHNMIHLKCRACFHSTCYFCEHSVEECICFRLPSIMVVHSHGYMSRMYRNRPRNRELTIDACVAEIAEMLNHQNEPMVMKCPVCQAHISKSVECNEMSHCGVKWCYCCGVMTLPNETFLCDHFGEGRICPRYESREFWQELGATQYKCREGLCYNECHECNHPLHQAGLLQKHVIHRMMWLRSYIRYTPRSLRQEILQSLAANGYEAFVTQLMYQSSV